MVTMLTNTSATEYDFIAEEFLETICQLPVIE